jgi:hypothetical protein
MTYRDEDGVRFFTEWRLCVACGRMFNRNVTPHMIGSKQGVTLFAHLVCPPNKVHNLRLERGRK